MFVAAWRMLCIVLGLGIWRVWTLKFSGKDLRGQWAACEVPTSRRLAVCSESVCGGIFCFYGILV